MLGNSENWLIGYTLYTILRKVFGQRVGYKIYKWRGWKVNLSINTIAFAVAVGIIAGILIDVKRAEGVHIVEVAEASPKEVRIEVISNEVQIEEVVDWTRERIIEEIYKVFPENGELAVRVAQCESGLRADIQSHHQLSYGRERSFSIFQVHEPDWADDAERLGLHDWRTDPGENIALARFIYESAGKRWTPWSCYTKRMI